MDTRERRRKTAIALGIVIIIMISPVGVAFADSYIEQLNDVRVACVGDSITQGSGYTQWLQKMLGQDYSVGNFGLAGATVSKDAKIPYIFQAQFREAMQFHPDIVIIMLGTNDANPEIAYNATSFSEDYTYLVNSFLNLESKPQIVIVDSPKMFVSSSSAYNDSYLINNLIPQVENVAKQYNLTSVNMYHAFEEHPDYYVDGVHPNEQGSELIATTMFDVVTSIQVGGQTA